MTKLKPQENVKEGDTVLCKLHYHPLTYYENTQSVQNSINTNYNEHINIDTTCQKCGQQDNDDPLWCCLQSHARQKIRAYCNTCF